MFLVFQTLLAFIFLAVYYKPVLRLFKDDTSLLRNFLFEFIYLLIFYLININVISQSSNSFNPKISIIKLVAIFVLLILPVGIFFVTILTNNMDV